MTETIVTNANVVLRDKCVLGSVVSRDGLITDVDEGKVSLRQAVDFEGDFLLPGLVELHTDNLERHVMPRPGVTWPAEAAVINHDREIVAAGITTVCNAMSLGLMDLEVHRSKFVDSLGPSIRALVDGGRLKADHYLHLRCELSAEDLLGSVAALIDDPAVRLISLMDHTPGQRQFRNDEACRAYYMNKYGLDDETFSEFTKRQRINQAEYAGPHRQAVVERAKERGVALASHDDATIEHVDEAVRDGVLISEFPTTEEAAVACHRSGLSVMTGGPNIVRGKSHSGNVSGRRLAELDLLDIISSDYIPSSLLFAAFTLADHIEAIDLPKAIRAAATTPAQLIGLDDRGEIAIGKRADFSRVRRCGSLPVVSEVWIRGARAN